MFLVLGNSTRKLANDTTLGAMDFALLQNEENVTNRRSQKYTQYSNTNRYDIGKYAAENGNANAVRFFQKDFPDIKESSVRNFKKKYYQLLSMQRKTGVDVTKSIPKTNVGRPLMLGHFDSMIQTYIRSMSNRGAVITWSIANAAAKALMRKYPGIVGNIDIDSSSWAQSLFRRMKFVKRRKTSSKVDIPEAARKEIEYVFLYEITSRVEKYNIPPSLVINLDQTPLKLVQCGNNTLAKKNSTNVTIAGSADKRSITGTFSITLSGNFLPVQLIYGGKTNQSLPRYKFPDEFSLSVNEKHFSNTKESIKLLKEIIIPYVEKERIALGLESEQKALVVMDVFTGQMTAEVSKIFEESNILVTNVPPNMTKFYQPLDLTVNGSAKRFMAKKFNGWYSDQITEQLESGKALEDVDVKLRLSILKPLHAGWVVDFYNYMTSADGKKLIENGWVASGIADAVRLGLKELPTLDPFSDIDPIIDDDSTVETNLNAICSLAPDEIEGYQRRDEEDDDSDSDEWESPESPRNAFDVFENFDDEEL